jgi:lipoate-protein ligase A
MRFHDDEFAGRPAFDTAVSRALLAAVGSGRLAETLRLYRPDDVVAFSPFDSVAPGFAEAIAAARAAGFGAIRRLAGGRAAVFHRETLAFAWCRPTPEPRAGVEARFEELSALVVRALVRLGVDARIGAVPGEYCPGKWSVNARGRTKLMGVGQRLVRGAAHVGGVIVVGQSRRVREALVPVYEAMGVEWKPSTAGSLDEEVAGATCAEVARVLLEEFRRDRELVSLCIDEESMRQAAGWESQHTL